MSYGPYRSRSPAGAPRSRDAADGTDLAAALVVLVVGAVPVLLTLARHGAWGVEASCGLLLSLFGAVWARHELRLAPRRCERRE